MTPEETTIRWFGSSWNSLMNEPLLKIPVPEESLCMSCLLPFQADDQGVRIPHRGDRGDHEFSYMHRLCMIDVLLS